VGAGRIGVVRIASRGFSVTKVTSIGLISLSIGGVDLRACQLASTALCAAIDSSTAATTRRFALSKSWV
jgi:tetrahydromethanopterin S-methyltransferase subunit C